MTIHPMGKPPNINNADIGKTRFFALIYPSRPPASQRGFTVTVSVAHYNYINLRKAKAPKWKSGISISVVDAIISAPDSDSKTLVTIRIQRQTRRHRSAETGDAESDRTYCRHTIIIGHNVRVETERNCKRMHDVLCLGKT